MTLFTLVRWSVLIAATAIFTATTDLAWLPGLLAWLSICALITAWVAMSDADDIMRRRRPLSREIATFVTRKRAER